MAKKESRSHAAPVTVISVAPAPPAASAIWITQPDGSMPVNCCFTVSGTAERLHVTIPDQHRVGHEAHFAEVTHQFLKYVGKQATLPAW